MIQPVIVRLDCNVTEQVWRAFLQLYVDNPTLAGLDVSVDDVCVTVLREKIMLRSVLVEDGDEPARAVQYIVPVFRRVDTQEPIVFGIAGAPTWELLPPTEE